MSVAGAWQPRASTPGRLGPIYTAAVKSSPFVYRKYTASSSRRRVARPPPRPVRGAVNTPSEDRRRHHLLKLQAPDKLFWRGFQRCAGVRRRGANSPIARRHLVVLPADPSPTVRALRELHSSAAFANRIAVAVGTCIPGQRSAAAHASDGSSDGLSLGTCDICQRCVNIERCIIEPSHVPRCLRGQQADFGGFLHSLGSKQEEAEAAQGHKALTCSIAGTQDRLCGRHYRRGRRLATVVAPKQP